jgi:hypothetical protein
LGCNPDLATIKKNCTLINRAPSIKPDYAGITLPANIAPLNFLLQDSSNTCIAEISSTNGKSIILKGNNHIFKIDISSWKKLLTENSGKPLYITIYTKDHHNKWYRYTAIENFIAADPIDRYCTYRLLNFQYNYSRDIRECQRDLSSFSEIDLINTQNCEFKCVNCHTPLSNDPDQFAMQVRSDRFGSQTLIANHKTITTLSSQLGHTAWHPNGRIIAFAAYKVQQYFHAVGKQFIDVFDNNSGIVIYDVVNKTTVPVPQLNQNDVLTTWPNWSPDGRYLYFCSSPVLWNDYNKEPPDNFNKTRYSLVRIAYDSSQNRWGPLDTVLNSNEIGLSIVQPKISPDNRHCLFCMQNYGAYPHTQVSSDLYLMELSSRQFQKLPVNSVYNESWHSWSRNSRWVLFSSKRSSGIFTRLYLCHIDSAGNASKPFLLPQRDPLFYDSFTKCYNVPEFAISSVRFTERQLLSAIQTKNSINVPVSQNISIR